MSPELASGMVAPEARHQKDKRLQTSSNGQGMASKSQQGLQKLSALKHILSDLRLAFHGPRPMAVALA